MTTDRKLNGQVFWITGLSGSGKTTIGTQLYYRLKDVNQRIVLLDGDIIKKLFGQDSVDYSKEGRRKRAFQYAELCKLLSDQGITVICCTIAMFDEVREWNRANIPHYCEIFIDVDIKTLLINDNKGLYKTHHAGPNAMVGMQGDADLPKNPDVVIRNAMDNNVGKYVEEILQFTGNGNATSDMATYWNAYYKEQKALLHPSGFANFALSYMKPGKKLIDLGCGNGRDSMFFQENGIKVTAIDSSEEAIRLISEKALPIFAVCDDFVAAKALFCVDYDYCYARWSIHAITQHQQNELLPSVYSSLCKGGLLFIEARTINDSKYGLGEKIGLDEYLLDGHYRRFIQPNFLKIQLEQTGFEVIFQKESETFSIIDEDAPVLVRIVAKRP